MDTVFDVLRALVKLLGAGELHDRALEVIDAAEQGGQAHEPEHAAPAGTEGTQP